MPRINKAIELLEQGQQVYLTGTPELSYEAGKSMAQTWADLLLVEFEHHAFDILGLTKFMRGLKDGGPTPSGHVTPAVVTTLPSNCKTPEEVLYNAWQARHVLTAGVHGILHTHARSPEAVRAFVAITRYSFQTVGRDRGVPEGLRGQGAQGEPAEVWALTPGEYVRKADPWPLNPDGELMLGLKIEDRHCLPNADAIAGTPGIAFAEWGPGDMGQSFGYADAHDPPYPPEMENARNTVKSACDKAGVAFYCGWADTTMSDAERVRFLIEEIGARIVAPSGPEVANASRKLDGRTMPV